MRKVAKLEAKGILPQEAKPAGDAHHIRFADAHIEKPLGIFFREFLTHGGLGQVGVQHHHFRHFRPERGQCFAIRFAGCFTELHVRLP